MSVQPPLRPATVLLAPALLAMMGCSELPQVGLDQSAFATTSRAETSGTADILKPLIFQTSARGLWDGRPTMGNVWVKVAGARGPERVEIRNEETGTTIRGAMFAAEDPTDPIPIKLSEKAALELGLAPLQQAVLTVTVLRPEGEDAEERAPSESFVAALPVVNDTQLALDSAPVLAAPQTDAPASLADWAQEPPARSTAPDYLEPHQLAAASATPEAEYSAEDFEGKLDGIAHVRASLPDGIVPLGAMVPPVWSEAGQFLSRNEALAVMQRLERRNVPAIECIWFRDGAQMPPVRRIFAAPSGGPTIRDAASFCAGAEANMMQTAPAQMAGTSLSSPSGPVRIKVGQSTGKLDFRSPDSIAAPIRISIAGVDLSLPPATSDDKILAILQAIKTDP